MKTSYWIPILGPFRPHRLRRLARSLIRRLREQCFRPYTLKKVIHGTEFDFFVGNLVGHEWYGVDWDWEEMRFIKERVITPGDVVFECGAHHGCTTVLFSRWVGPEGAVVAFEPHPENAEILRRNLQLNELQNVEVKEQAAGARFGTVSINGISNANILAIGENGIQVKVIPLDAFKEMEPTVLKIDVEGYEGEVIKGASEILSSKPKVILEVHTEALAGFGTSASEILNMLGPESYDVFVQWSDGARPVSYSRETPINQRVHLFFLPKGEPKRRATHNR